MFLGHFIPPVRLRNECKEAAEGNKKLDFAWKVRSVLPSLEQALTFLAPAIENGGDLLRG
jgi:hypothetical protein